MRLNDGKRISFSRASKTQSETPEFMRKIGFNDIQITQMLKKLDE